MSNQQWPPPGGNGPHATPPSGNPWAQPNGTPAPQNYGSPAGRDPRRPFGQAAEPVQAPALEEFQPPKRSNKKTLWMGGSIIAAVVALVLVLQFTGGFLATDPTASSSPSVASAPEEAPVPAATGGTSIPFEGNGTGVFEILGQEWTAEGLSIDYRISLDEGQGERSFSLYMFTNKTLEVADPVNYELATVSPGNPFTGVVQFDVEQDKGTLVLSSFSTALAALPITG